MKTITLTINGSDHRSSSQGTLLSYLRDELGLVGTKNGCGTGECGSCTVIVNGRARRSCTIDLGSLDGAEVTTIEGLTPEAIGTSSLHPIQDAFLRHGAVQCGFCTPGMILSVKALLDRNPHPSESETRSALQGNICRCTGYLPILRAVGELAGAAAADTAPAAGSASTRLPMETETAAPGDSPRRKDGLAKVRGERLFAADYAVEGQLHGAFAFAEYPHARLLAVDTAAAEAVDGVVTVLTAADLPGRNGYGLMVPHQPVFASGEIRYRGEVVAAVFAESEEAAREAAALVKGSYEPLEAMMDPAANMAEGAGKLHRDGNVAEHYDFVKGDPEAAFSEADIIIEGEYETPAVEHAYLEPESCLAVPGPGVPQFEVDAGGAPAAAAERGAAAAGARVATAASSPDATLTVYTYNQGSYRFREMIAASLDLPESAVRVVYTPCGGGFGGKEEPAIQIPCALATYLTGRPAKVTLSREESIRISTKRHASKVRMRHAAKSDGTILAMESTAICDAGAYMSLTQPVVFRATVMASGPYEIPNVRAEAYGVYTTKNPSGAFRGFGSTQVTFAAEIQMDKVARAAGVDPMELRKRHALAPGRVNAFGHRLSKGIGYPQTLEAVEREASSALSALRSEEARRAAEAGTPERKIGVGFASSYKNVGLGKGVPDGAGALLELDGEGNLTVYVGATDMGQGSDTVFAQIAAAELSIPYQRITVLSSDTARCPDGGMTTASRQTFVTGNAVARAARDMAARITKAGGLAAAAGGAGGVLRVEAWYDAPKTYPLQRIADSRAGVREEEFGVHFAYCFSSQAVILAMDPDERGFEILRVIAAQDAGRVIHRQNVLGQIEGGVMMGLGYGLQEHYEVDAEGLGARSLRECGVVRIKEMPPVTSCIIEEPHPEGPFEAKGLGEVPLNPTAPAIANAIGSLTGRYPNKLPIRLS